MPTIGDGADDGGDEEKKSSCNICAAFDWRDVACAMPGGATLDEGPLSGWLGQLLRGLSEAVSLCDVAEVHRDLVVEGWLFLLWGMWICHCLRLRGWLANTNAVRDLACHGGLGWIELDAVPNPVVAFVVADDGCYRVKVHHVQRQLLFGAVKREDDLALLDSIRTFQFFERCRRNPDDYCLAVEVACLQEF